MTSRFVGLPCCWTIICDNAFLPTPAKYECQAPKIWVPRDQPVSGPVRRSAGSGGEDPENQVAVRYARHTRAEERRGEIIMWGSFLLAT